MLDLKLLQRDFENISTKLSKKGVDATVLEDVKNKSLVYKEAKKELEELQATQNSLSKEFGIYKQKGQDTTELKAKVDSNKEKIIALTDSVRVAEDALNELAMILPNIPDDDVVVGADENDNIEIKVVGTKPTFTFTPKEHWELAEQNGWIDFEKGVKLAKSRFSVLRKEAATLERALINYMLKFNKARGFEEVYVPFIANRATLTGTGQLPKFENDLFKIAKDDENEDTDLFLIPTAEVPLTNLYRDEIIPANQLPILLTGYTPCFRKEAGSASRDTRGIIRQHQFDKVELVAITKQEDSEAMLQKMVDCASDLLDSLGLHHRQVMLCTGDLGFGAAKTIDIEVWLPGQNKFREISSVSNTRDFQARRAMIRYKEDGKNILAHTLNGSSLAVGRTLIAIMENYQQNDGSIIIPQVLREYM